MGKKNNNPSQRSNNLSTTTTPPSQRNSLTPATPHLDPTPSQAVNHPANSAEINYPPSEKKKNYHQESKSSKNAVVVLPKSPPEILDEYCNLVIQRGDYLDSQAIAKDLIAIMQKLKYEKLFRDIQSLNRFVDSGIEAYWHSTSIRIFFELEKFVLNLYNKWAHLDLETFEDIGIGTLARHPKIVEYFKFYQIPFQRNLLPEVSMENLIKLTIRYLNTLDRDCELNKATQDRFMAFLLDTIAREDGVANRNHIGIVIDFKDLYHKIKSTRYLESQQIRNVRIDLASKVTAKIQSSMNQLFSENTSSQIDLRTLPPDLTSLLKHHKVDLSTLYNQMKSFFSPLNSSTFSGIIEHFFELMPLADNPSSMLSLYFAPKKSTKKKTIKDQQLKIFNTCLAVLVLYIWKSSPKVSHHDNEDEEDSDLGTEDSVGSFPAEESKGNATSTKDPLFELRSYFSEKLTVDIPQYALSQVQQRVIALSKHFLEVDQDTASTSIRENIQTLLTKARTPEEKKSPESIMAHYVAVTTATVILFRLLSTGTAGQSPDKVEIEDIILSNLQKTQQQLLSFELQPEQPLILSLEQIFFTFLDHFEKSVKFDLKLLSFELLGEDSFVSFLRRFLSSHPSTSILKDLLDPTICSYLESYSQRDDWSAMNSNSNQSLIPMKRFEINHSEFAAALHVTVQELLPNISSDENLLEMICHFESLICSSLGVNDFAEVSSVSVWKYIQDLFASARTESCSPDIIKALEQWDNLFSIISLSNKSVEDHLNNCEIVEPTLSFSLSLKILHLLSVLHYKAHHLSTNLNSNSYEIEKEMIDYLINNFQVPKSLARSVAQPICEDPALILQSAPTNVHIDSTFFVSLPPNDEISLNQQSIEEDALYFIATTPLGCSCSKFCQWDTTYAPFLPQTETETENSFPISIIDFIIDNHLKLLSLRSDISFVPIGNDVYPVSTHLPSLELFQKHVAGSQWSELTSYLIAAVTGVTSTTDCSMRLKELILILNESLGWDSLLKLVTATSFLIEDARLQGKLLELFFNAISFCCDISVSSVQTKLMDTYLHGDLNTSPDLTSAKKLLGVALINQSLNRDTWSSLCSYRPLVLERCRTSEHNKNVTELDSMASELSDPVDAPSVQEVSSQPLPDREAQSSATPLSSADTTADSLQVIQNLLVNDFGYSLDGKRPSEDSPVTRKLKNALEHLSTSLYGSDVHFVMELVQNADDNTYAPGVKPTIKFQLYPHSVVVYNNETGFQRENIIAICGVGGSTKKGLAGYIGQKGIGFKSVFTVSDFPELHSNGPPPPLLSLLCSQSLILSSLPCLLPSGYHIGFDREYMIEPIWLPERREEQSSAEGGELYKWPSKYDSSDTFYETCFRLKLDEKNKRNILKLTQNLTDACDENLLLFLNKLERMIYEDHLQKKKLEFSKIRLSSSWYRLLSRYDYRETHSHSQQQQQVREMYWCTVRKVLKPNGTGAGTAGGGKGIMRAKNQFVESTEIAIALKFIPDKDNEGEEGDENEDNESRSKVGKGSHISLLLDTSSRLPIYAYLPTKAEPYRFIIQGDFLLSTSRESLLQDNDWNHYLFANFPDLFLSLFSELSELAWNFPNCVYSSQATQVCPILTEVLNSSSSSNSKISLHVTPQDLLNLIPRVSLSSSSSSSDSHSSSNHLYAEFASTVSLALKEMKFLRNSANQPISPQQFVNISSLHFNPLDFISEEFFTQATGLHFIPSEPSLLFTEELLSQLSVPQFDVTIVMKCFDFFAEHFLEIRAQSEGNYWKLFSGLILCLCEIISPSAPVHPPPHGNNRSSSTPAAGGAGGAGAGGIKWNQRVAPSQVVRKAGGRAGVHQTSIFSSGLGLLLPKATVNKLRKLPIWPTTRKTYVAANPEDLVFFRSPVTADGSNGSKSLSDLQLKCLKIFEEEYLVLLDTDSLFKAADKLHRNGMKIISEMLIKNFKAGGGIEELTPQIIVHKVILPSYAKYDLSDRNTHLTRHIASAFLGFLFATLGMGGMDVSKELAVHGVIVPTLCARDYQPANSKDTKVRWQMAEIGNILVKPNRTLEDVATGLTPEVHLGLEVQSCSRALAKLQITTAMRQLRWLIIDPMVSILIFNNIPIANLPETFETETETPYGPKNQNEIKWTQFLLNKVGLVNFFGVYRSKNLTAHDLAAPSLIAFLSHLTRNGDTVFTDREEWLISAESPEPDLPEEHGDSEGDEKKEGQSRQQPLYCPHFLPSSQQNKNLLSVSANVHQSLQSIACWIMEEIHFLGVPLGSQLHKELNSRPWFPVESHGIYNLIESREDTTPPPVVHLLAAPMDILSVVEVLSLLLLTSHFPQTHKWFGPHCLYIPSRFADYQQNSFEFYRISLDEFNIDFYSKFLCWLSTTARCYSTLQWMKMLYLNFLKSLSSSIGQQRLSVSHHKVLNLIQDQKPFLWIPETVPIATAMSGSQEKEESDELMLGKMYPLSDLVIRDPTEKFDHSLTPIRVISRFYADPKFLSLFTRVRVCPVCTAYEGLFGRRGQPLGGGVRALIYEQQCTCEDRGFGQYLGAMSGLVRTSPNLSDMLSFIKNLISRYQQINSDGSVSRGRRCSREEDALVVANPKDLQSNLLKRIKELLGIISREVWKCFNIQNCIHGYNPTALQEMRREFTQEALLPTLLTSHFVSLEVRSSVSEEEQTRNNLNFLLAVDDMETFKLFQSEFVKFEKQQQEQQDGKARHLYLIDGSNDEPALWQEEYIPDAHTYDLSEYEISFRHFLQLPSSEFYAKATGIPPETFFAPNSLLPLLKYLQVPTLSHFTTSEWILGLTSQSHRSSHRHRANENPPAAHSFVPLMNALLLMTQGFIAKEFSSCLSIPLLTASLRIQRLRHLSVKYCDDLHRLVAVNIPQLSLQIDAKKQSQEFHYSAEENVLYLDSSISYLRCCELVIFLICKAVKVEIALMTLNQQIDFMNSLKNNLVKYSKIKDFSIDLVFELENLPKLPEEMERWTLYAIAPTEEVLDQEEDEEEQSLPPTDTLSHHDALEGFDRMKKRNKNSSRPAKAAPPPKEQQQDPMSEESEKYKAEKALRDKLLVEGLLRDDPVPTQSLNLPQPDVSPVILRNDAPWDPSFAQDKLPDSLKRYEEVFTAPSPHHSSQHLLPSGSGEKITIGSHSQSDDGAVVSPSSRPQNLDQSLMTPVRGSFASGNGKQIDSPEDLRIPGATTPHPRNETSLISFPSPLFEQSQSLLEVIDRVDIGAVVDLERQQIEASSSVPNSPERNENMFLGNFASNLFTGRIGERIAVSLLSSLISSDGTPQLKEILWLNEEREEYQPYDLLVTSADDKQRYCEVKTRVWSEEDGQYIPQWFISPKEIEAASRYQEQYFCILIALTKDGSLQLKDVQFLGYEAGLVQAMKSHQAHLVIQLATGALSSSSQS